ncbi:MAG: pseudouridine synthase, partial [Myxococcota bacterium]
QPQFEAGTVDKQYLVEVEGHPNASQWYCTAPIGRAVGSAGRRRTAPDGDKAKTAFTVLERRSSTTLLVAQPFTGRTNQIRIHAAESGHPVVGDAPYGKSPDSPMTRAPSDPAMHLHAWRLAVDHPATGARLQLVTDAPAWVGQLTLAGKSFGTTKKRARSTESSHSEI